MSDERLGAIPLQAGRRDCLDAPASFARRSERMLLACGLVIGVVLRASTLRQLPATMKV